MVTGPPTAVKGPMVAGDDGMSRVRPGRGDRLGDGHVESHRARGHLRRRGSVGVDVTGRQPVEAAVAEPHRGGDGPRGDRDVGLVPRDLELVAGRQRGGEIVADVVTSLKTRSPTGVCGQYSS